MKMGKPKASKMNMMPKPRMKKAGAAKMAGGAMPFGGKMKKPKGKF